VSFHTGKFDRAILSDRVTEHLHRRFVRLRSDDTLAQSLARIHQEESDQQIVYFYVLDEAERLVGVVPVRSLLFEKPDSRIADIMIPEVITVSDTTSIADAGATLLEYKLLAVPVVDAKGRMLGVLDLSHFTEDALDTLSMVQRPQTDRVFQMLGLHISLNRHVSVWAHFRERFPWLLCNVASGLLCAIIASFYELLIQQIVLLAMFMTVVLALGESVSMQAMTITLQALNVKHFSWGIVRRFLRKELAASLLLGIGCGTLIGAAAFIWKGQSLQSFAISLSVVLSILTACALGVVIPSLIRALRMDPKIAAGPIVLACADVATLLFYFNVMRMLAQP
jgi:magnesium transporter